MSDTKMLQAILNGQRSLKEELSGKIDKLDNKVVTLDKKVDTLEKKVDEGFETVNNRLDKIGLSLARLEDDTPTIDEFEKLVRRVTKLENKILEN